MRIMLLPLFMLLLSACSGPGNDASRASFPADSIYSKEEMIRIMADVHIVESALLLKKNKGLKTDSLANLYYQGVFKKYRMTRARYDTNLAFYRQQPEEFSKMYDEVIRILAEKEKAYVDD
jgi:hypothetical protein